MRTCELLAKSVLYLQRMTERPRLTHGPESSACDIPPATCVSNIATVTLHPAWPTTC